MTRTLIFMSLIAISILISSCDFLPICAGRTVEPLEQTIREKLNLVKKEANSALILTTEKVKRNEIDEQIGNALIDTLTETIKHMDTLIATSYQVVKTGLKERILQFAYSTEQVTTSMQKNLKSLRDLYDISTNSQFETTSFFPADSFTISPEKMDEAKKAIEPVAQRIVRFLGDHPRQKFEAVIACSSSADNQEQIGKLCKLRARSIAWLLIDQIKSNKEFIPNPERIHYNIKWVDQSETLPNSGNRRNTVLLIWNVVPASLYAGSFDH